MNPRTKEIGIAVIVIVATCVLSFFGVLVGAAVIGYRAAIRAGNEVATIQNLKTIASVEAQYFYSHNRTFGTFDQLISDYSLSSKFSGHTVVADDYVFTLTLAPKADGSSWYKLTADPQNDETGTNHFYLDSDDYQIRVSRDRKAGPADPTF